MIPYRPCREGMQAHQGAKQILVLGIPRLIAAKGFAPLADETGANALNGANLLQVLDVSLAVTQEALARTSKV
jgi:hypothetical protein